MRTIDVTPVVMRVFPKCCLWILFLVCSCLAVSCSGAYGDSVQGTKVQMRHSSLLEISDCDGYSVVEVKNPWGKGLLERYILVPYDSVMPVDLPKGTVLRTPLRRTVLFSGVHASLFEELGVLATVAGVCDRRYIYSSLLQEAIEDGAVADCGSSLNVDSEVVAYVNPDAIFVLPYENGGYGKLDKMSYPLVECADYMESSPLGCAEWMRFYGRLVGCAEKSDSLYEMVCNEYEALSRMVENVSERPKLMCELKSSSAWYVPGGNSTMGQMYRDAGADYLFADYDAVGSVPLSFEVVLDKASDADIWLFKYNAVTDWTYSSLLAGFSGYSHFKPFREKNIYACNTGRNNIFEESSFHPERLLKELVALFHPSLVPGYRHVYYEKIH